MSKLSLNLSQLNRASEVLGNISVAWFTAGVISPLFVRPKSIPELVSLFVLSIVMAGLFFIWSLSLVKGVKS